MEVWACLSARVRIFLTKKSTMRWTINSMTKTTRIFGSLVWRKAMMSLCQSRSTAWKMRSSCGTMGWKEHDNGVSLSEEDSRTECFR